MEHTRQRVEQVGRFIDELEAELAGPMASAAELVLRNHMPRPRRVDPGE